MQHGKHGLQVVKGRARGEGVVVEGAAGAAWGAWVAGSKRENMGRRSSSRGSSGCSMGSMGCRQ
jgi:hypothetical protein